MLRANCPFAKSGKTSKVLTYLITSVLLISVSACRNVGNSFSSLFDEVVPLPFNVDLAWGEACATMRGHQGWMYADTYTRPFYETESPQLLWTSEEGVSDKVDTLLYYLREAENCGLKRSNFHLDEIERELQVARAYVPDSCDEASVSRTMGRLDYLLTEAYMRYAYGQRYGYVRPYKLFNNLLLDTPEPGTEPTEKKYRKIFALDCDIPSDSLFQEALDALSDADELGEFLGEIQPRLPLYSQLKDAYVKAKASGQQDRMRLCAINLERSRWRYPRPTEDKYVWVNLTDYYLEAVDLKRDSVLKMKVCIGDKRHKTPLLGSRINRLELNPYWIIPTSIIRNELIPNHLNDSSYYARNSIVAVHNQTKEEVQPWLLSAAQLKSGNYTLRQEKGAGNSLGRMIFRFPNEFAVYLHDTNNRSAFANRIRALSHGCIRVEKPFDLAVFLMEDPDELSVDKIRMAIDKAPLSDKGKKWREENPEAEGMKVFSYKPSIPVYLDYYTLYPDPKTGELISHEDNYGYDKEIERILLQF